MTILVPCDAFEMKNLMSATLKWPHPIYIRLARGGDQIITKKNRKFVIGKSVMIKKPQKYLFLTTGIATQIALNASKKLDNENNIKCGVIHFPSIKPLDTRALLKWIKKVKKIITVEENILSGGFGSSILEFCNDHLKEHTHKISRIGLKDKFADDYGDQNSLLNKNDLNQRVLYKKMLSLIKNS